MSHLLKDIEAWVGSAVNLFSVLLASFWKIVNEGEERGTESMPLFLAGCI